MTKIIIKLKRNGQEEDPSMEGNQPPVVVPLLVGVKKMAVSGLCPGSDCWASSHGWLVINGQDTEGDRTGQGRRGLTVRWASETI
jgi:hypothetical protein